MWARDFELSLGLWLAVSPFVFGHGPDEVGLWITDLVCAALIVTIAVVSRWHRLRRAHLAHLLIAGWLIGRGWLATRSAIEGGEQNHIVVGLLLATFAIVPSESSQPPPAWRRAPEP